MYINITDSETGNNKGSSGQLVNYLEKENRTAFEEERENELWFNNLNRGVTPQEVRVKIDNNIAKLSRNDAKFFLINISPSEKEITYLKEQFGEKGAEEELKKYASFVMDAYARNFKRTGIESSKDLLWYGKLERCRYFHHIDEEVKKGIAQVGQPQEGEQMHIQIIVSRKDITNKIKLSPMNNSRGKNEKHSAKLGQFNRVAFKESGELLFDQMFDYDRLLKETMDYSLIMKNGNPHQKQTAYLLEQLEDKLPNPDKQSFLHIAKKLIKSDNIESEPLFDMANLFIPNFKNNTNSLSSLIESLGGLLPQSQGEDYEEQQFANEIKKKKRKNKGRRPT